MYKVVDSPYLAPFDSSFKHASMPTAPPQEAPRKGKARERLKEQIDELDELQRKLYAHDHHSLLLIFQAMDAAGKDSTIRAVMSGIDPAGCQVFSFKQPSKEELDHDFLWRTSCRLPERGRIGIFNRSYYEEVLAVRVHPEYLTAQRLPQSDVLETLWQERYESICDHEKHLARNGTVILKFWLNISRKEQRERFLARIDDPNKNWKFSEADVAERKDWKKYMQAYEQAVAATSHPWAPWYVIPADDKPYMRLTVAEIIVQRLRELSLSYPVLDNEVLKRFKKIRKMLKDD